MRIDNPTFGPNQSAAIPSASFAATASLLLGSVVSASFATSASRATTASFATSASFAPTRITYAETQIAQQLNIGFTSTQIASVSIPSAGVYRITTIIRADVTVGGIPNIWLTDNSNTEIANSRLLPIFSNDPTLQSNLQVTATMVNFVTYAAAGTLRVYAACYNNSTFGVVSDGDGVSKVIWERISN
jgi:hypothetical protein